MIAEINPAMPRTRGDSCVPADRIDYAIEVDTPVTEYVHEPVTGPAEKIARYVARLVDDHSTIQVGLGRVPNEMLRHLHHRRDLSVHSDVITDAVVDLVDAGVVTGPVVGSWAMGTTKLYERLATDERFSLHPIEYICDPEVIARHDRMVSVTQAFTMDLSGQACTERLDGRMYGGISTGPDFHRGALAATRGVPVVCLTSRTPGGKPAFRVALGDRRAGGSRPVARPLGGHRVRHGVPLRPLAGRACHRADRHRPPRRPRVAPRAGAERGHRQAGPGATEQGRLPG